MLSFLEGLTNLVAQHIHIPGRRGWMVGRRGVARARRHRRIAYPGGGRGVAGRRRRLIGAHRRRRRHITVAGRRTGLVGGGRRRGLVGRVVLRVVDAALAARRVRAAWRLLRGERRRARVVVGAGRRLVEVVVVVLPAGHGRVADSRVPGAGPARGPGAVLAVARRHAAVVWGSRPVVHRRL